MAEGTTEELADQSDVDEPDGDLAADEHSEPDGRSEPHADSEPAEDGEQDASAATEVRPRPARRWLSSVAALALVFVALVGAAVFLARPVLAFRADSARRAAIIAVATDVAQRSYSLSFQTFPQQSGAIIAETSGNYRQGLVSSERGLQYILTQGQVKSTCTITAAGIERDDANTATVLLSITSSVTNTQIHTPQVRYYRVAMNLERQGAKWLVESNDVIA
jgi:Mce-associated membrane protein